MNITYTLLKSEISKLSSKLCNLLGADTEGKKFSLLLLKKLSGARSKKLKKFFTEGSGDHQVDAIYFDEEGNDLRINILLCKFTSKTEDSIQDKDVTDFLNNGISYLINGEEKVIDFNERIFQMREEIKDEISTYENNYSILLKFVSTSNNPLSKNGIGSVNKFISEYQKTGININYEEINNTRLSEIFSTKSVLKTKIPIKLSGRSYYQLVGREGFVCRLPVSELLKIYKGFEDNDGNKIQGYGDFLFTDNVRRDLGLEKKINLKIYETCINDDYSKDFEFFNNGLTIIYDEMRGTLSSDSPVVFISGMQVVNGCQTVSTLIKAYDEELLKDDIYITSRFIKKNEEKQFIQSVITFTNSQNAITDRDLHSNDRIQYDIQGVLSNMGVFYERKLNEFKDEDDDKRLDSFEAAQAYLCCELEEPHNAKQFKKRIFAEYYNKIFDLSKADLAYKFLISFKILEYVLEKQTEKRKQKRETMKSGKTPKYNTKDLVISHGSYHIATLLYRKFFKGKDIGYLERHSKSFNYEKRFRNSYCESVEKISKYFDDNDIAREDFAKTFKSEGIDKYI